jgi:hypothetical protein
LRKIGLKLALGKASPKKQILNVKTKIERFPSKGRIAQHSCKFQIEKLIIAFCLRSLLLPSDLGSCLSIVDLGFKI